MHDISEMTIVKGEVAMSRRLKELGWANTEQFANRTVYKNRRGEVIGITLFWHQGGTDHTHFVK
jgi:hypothetical protein